MAIATSAGSFWPIAVGNRRGGQEKSIGVVPASRNALEDELSKIEV